MSIGPPTRTSARSGAGAAIALLAAASSASTVIAHVTAPRRHPIVSIDASYRSVSLHETSRRTEIEIEILGREAEALADVADRFLELHQRDAHGFNFFTSQRLFFHPPDRLALHESTQELDDRQDELRDRFLNVLGLRVPSERRGLPARRRRGCEPLLQFATKRTQLRSGDARGLRRARGALGPRLRPAWS